jgi:ribonuclease-3
MVFSISWFKALWTKKDSFHYRIYQMTGLFPNNIHFYQQALTHKSVAVNDANGKSNDNERLEFLGDAILDSILADFLFKKFPYEDEGFLTQMRSKVVNRKQLSQLALDIGLDRLVRVDGKRHNVHSSIYGNAFEAFIGAIYLDQGFVKVYHYVVSNIINQHLDICALRNTETNYKSRLLEWCQKENHSLSFNTSDNPEKENTFHSYVVLNRQEYSKAVGHTKKEAEQNASFIVLKHFGLLADDK